MVKIVRFRILVTFLCVLSGLCVKVSAQEFKPLKDGVEYAEVSRKFSGKPVNINLLRLDLKKVRLDVHHALDTAIGTEQTSAIAIRHGAFAAINAGFFRLDKSPFAGDSAGLLMIDGKILSEPVHQRIQLMINNKPRQTEVYLSVALLSQAFKIGKESFNIQGVNRERKQDDLVLYTPEFHGTTLTGGDGVEIVVITGNVASIKIGPGNSVIPRDGFVISASGSLRDRLTKAVATAKTVSISRRWNKMPANIFQNETKMDVVAGVPQLIKNSKIDITWEEEKSSKAFVETRHPRTAVAKLNDGKFLMITVDGRSETSAGIDLYDLAAYLLELGATDAMNLDGGGSTTMFVNGKVVNRPSDPTGERKVGDAILVTLRKKI